MERWKLEISFLRSICWSFSLGMADFDSFMCCTVQNSFQDWKEHLLENSYHPPSQIGANIAYVFCTYTLALMTGVLIWGGFQIITSAFASSLLTLKTTFLHSNFGFLNEIFGSWLLLFHLIKSNGLQLLAFVFPLINDSIFPATTNDYSLPFFMDTNLGFLELATFFLFIWMCDVLF